MYLVCAWCGGQRTLGVLLVHLDLFPLTVPLDESGARLAASKPHRPSCVHHPQCWYRCTCSHTFFLTKPFPYPEVTILSCSYVEVLNSMAFWRLHKALQDYTRPCYKTVSYFCAYYLSFGPNPPLDFWDSLMERSLVSYSLCSQRWHWVPVSPVPPVLALALELPHWASFLPSSPRRFDFILSSTLGSYLHLHTFII